MQYVTNKNIVKNIGKGYNRKRDITQKIKDRKEKIVRKNKKREFY
jgi:hypothetical protein